MAIYGPNGAGKTNILEAVSLFSPGRGMRRASAEEMTPQARGDWLETQRARLRRRDTRLYEIESLVSEGGAARQVRIDGKPATSDHPWQAGARACGWCRLDGSALDRGRGRAAALSGPDGAEFSIPDHARGGAGHMKRPCVSGTACSRIRCATLIGTRRSRCRWPAVGRMLIRQARVAMRWTGSAGGAGRG